MFDLIIRGGLVADGTGAALARADLGIVSGRIEVIDGHGNLDHAAASDIVDATGRVVCPGFVDIHTHSDLTLLSAPTAPSKVQQGVTTEVVGNCGLGLAPLGPRADVAAVRSAVGYLDLDSEVLLDWRSFDEYLDTVADVGPALNVAAFAAHLPLHASATGLTDRPAAAAEIAEMAALLDGAFDAGAVGLSTGLVYAPLCYAEEAELLALAQVVARRDRLFAWHVRDYADGLIPSVIQAIRIARTTGCRTQISHLAAVGRRNWGAVRDALELVDEARSEGLDVAVDTYPYTAGNAPLSQLLPDWSQSGGSEAFQERLADPTVRKRIEFEWRDNPVGWDEIVLTWLPESGETDLVGHTIAELAERASTSAAAMAMDVLQAFGGAALIVAHGRSDEDLRTVLRHPATVVASDGQALDPTGVTGRGVPHPRSYGCFPRYLSRYAEDLADGIRRCTSGPAARVGLADRGVLKPGSVADVVVFEPERLTDRATYETPHQFPDGIDLVVVGGRVAVRNGVATATRTGRVLRVSA